ncbi:MAG: hypothetical protein ACJA1A_001746 [Saprospiraceae bacterium]|jgi:hypothetical protein|tara:strand:- start:258 stop:596 length:339 start_codon:yes stop_codon:yes gene_type:complete
MILFLKLLIAHLITDFFIQPNSWIEDKKQNKGKSKYLFLHVFITGFVAFGIMAKLEYWWIAAIITVSHYIIDWYKLSVMGDSLKSFLVDQILHLTVIAFCALSIGNVEETFY